MVRAGRVRHLVETDSHNIDVKPRKWTCTRSSTLLTNDDVVSHGNEVRISDKCLLRELEFRISRMKMGIWKKWMITKVKAYGASPG